MLFFFPNVEFVAADLQLLDVVTLANVVPFVNGPSSGTRKIVVEVPQTSKRSNVDPFNDNVFNELFIF
jgi:hypothetical protein